MVEQIGQVELQEWLQKGERMVGSLRVEAGLLVERSKTLVQYAKQIEAAIKTQGGRQKVRCEGCGNHRLSKAHRENCGLAEGAD